MMDTSDECYSDLEESFSFTCCDLDDNGDAVVDDDDDDDESYIEIALEPLPTTTDADCLKLRVSFSSSRVPETVSSGASTSSSPSSSEGRGAEAELISSGLSRTNPKGTNSIRRLQFSAINRALNAFVSSFRVPSPEESVRIDGNRPPAASSVSRKASKVTTAINGSITKIMIKIRSIKIRPALTPFVKTRLVLMKRNQDNKKKKKGMKYYSEEKMSSGTSSIWIHHQSKKLLEWETVREKRGDHVRRKGSKIRSGGLDINMDAIRGVLMEAISNISSSSRRGGRRKQMKTKTKTKSCPGSIKCSPINEGGYSGDNSVQAAIAHCKRSFAQPHDFCFSN